VTGGDDAHDGIVDTSWPFSAVYNRTAAYHKVPWRRFSKTQLTDLENAAGAGEETVKYVSDDYLFTRLAHLSAWPKLKAAALCDTYTAATTIAVELDWRKVNMDVRAIYIGRKRTVSRAVSHPAPRSILALQALKQGAPGDRVFGFKERFALPPSPIRPWLFDTPRRPLVSQETDHRSGQNNLSFVLICRNAHATFLLEASASHCCRERVPWRGMRISRRAATSAKRRAACCVPSAGSDISDWADREVHLRQAL